MANLRYTDGSQTSIRHVLLPLAYGSVVRYSARSSQGRLATASLNNLEVERTSGDAVERRLRRVNDEGRQLFSWNEEQPLFLNMVLILDVRYTDALQRRHREDYVIGPTLTERIPAGLARRLRKDYWAKMRAKVYYDSTGPLEPRSKAKTAEEIATGLADAHVRFPDSEILWSQCVKRFGKETDTGVYVNHYEWPMD
jgi:hypothetical protein